MRTIILNKFSDLGKNETNNGNKVFKHRDCLGAEIHSFQIATLEPFNFQRKEIYQDSDVVDGDIICHKMWFEYDKFLEKAFDDENLYPMEITWDHRFYVVVKGYDGKSYAVNVNPDFYSDLVKEDNRFKFNKYGVAQRLIIPIEDLSDDYVFALSNSFIMKRFSECSDFLIRESSDIVSPSLVDIYEINERDLSALRIVTFINHVKQRGYQNIVISYNRSSNDKSWFKMHMSYAQGAEGIYFSFTGHYTDNDVVICRPQVAKEYEKKGYILFDYDDIVDGRYMENKEYEKKGYILFDYDDIVDGRYMENSLLFNDAPVRKHTN